MLDHTGSELGMQVHRVEQEIEHGRGLSEPVLNDTERDHSKDVNLIAVSNDLQVSEGKVKAKGAA